MSPRTDPASPLESPHDSYQSPLAGRYASDEMKRIWSARHKYELWRKIWLAVAQAQHEVGLPVTKAQVDELAANLDVTDDDIALAERYEAELRHDVMSHVHAWGDKCPGAKGIIHLGMTSQDVNDNCELIQLRQAAELIDRRVAAMVVALGEFAESWKSTPTLGFTHYQPAQPTTVGRRAVQWASDLDLPGAAFFRYPLDKQRGLRGATGTQASYLALVDGDHSKVVELEARFLIALSGAEVGIDPINIEDWVGSDDDIYKWYDRQVLESKGCDDEEDRLAQAASLRDQALSQSHDERLKHAMADISEEHTFDLTGQTYPRILDAQYLSHLASISAVLHKIATDIRLLCNRKELDEPFASKQIGSSAMPYKRNPMRCERVCGLARFVMNLVGNAYETAATQWLERTLDDSANRRLTLPEAFLATDACLGIMHNVISGLIVHEATVRKNLMAELPFMASENLMMEAVKLGRDRQEVHEAIRVHAQEAGRRVKDEGADNDLIERLRSEPLLEGVDLDAALDPMLYVGLAVEQTERFLREVVDPMRDSMEDVGEVEDLKL